MKSLWNEAHAVHCASELALRVYSSRLLGSDTSLVLHGGGNTSVKLDEGSSHTLYVKGTGSDLAQLVEADFTPLRLDSVTQVLQQPELGNSAMMQALDGCLLRRPAPRPSIETLLHAGLPFRFVEHTHADAVLAALNVESIEAVHGELYGDRAPLVSYHHSGHTLARACMQVFASCRTANTIGLVLAFHGVVAFGNDARSSYLNMIELVTRAENYLRARGAWHHDGDRTAPAPAAPSATALEALCVAVRTQARAPLAVHVVTDPQTLAFAQRADVHIVSQQGPATPQHAVYTRRVPMIGRNVGDYAKRYRAYLDQHLGAAASGLLDAAPRIVLDAQFGLCAFGKTEREARIAAEMYRHDIAVISRASAHARYCSASPAAIAQAEFEYGGHAARLQQASTP